VATGLGSRADSSFGAELFAILALLSEACDADSPLLQLHVFCDCRSVLDALAGRTKTVSHVTLYNAACDCIRTLHARGCALTLYWIPGHAGIPYNEEVDALAKGALESDPTSPLLPLYKQPLASARARITRAARTKWTERWSSLASAPHLRAIKPAPAPWSHCWSDKRERDTTLCKLRNGTCLALHLHGIQPALPPDCSVCGVDEDTQHFLLDCRRFVPERAAMQREVEWSGA
jgi:ribonuclease HI